MRSDETTRTDKRRSGKALKEGQGSSGKGEGPQTIAEAEKRSRKRPELRKSSESEKRKSKSAEADDRSRRKAEAHRKLKISKAQQHQNDGRAEERKLRGPERGQKKTAANKTPYRIGQAWSVSEASPHDALVTYASLGIARCSPPQVPDLYMSSLAQ